MTTININEEQYNLIQVALWNMTSKVQKQMAEADNQEDINALYVYAQEITNIKYDLRDAFMESVRVI